MAQSHRPDARGEPPPSGVVELRIHGVGGTPPEEILDVPVTCLVAGDESAGFFRPWGQDDGPSREAYSWGGLTSAARLRALWVLLTPFALANLAGWMLRHGGRPTDRGPRRRDGLEASAVAVIRGYGLVLTVALAAYVALGAIDLVGFQCGARPACVEGRWWLSPWDNRLVDGDPGRSMTMGAILAVGIVLGVAWLARRSQMAIHDRAGSFTPVDDPVLTVNLNHGRMWESPHVAHRLGLTHTAAALSAIGLTLAVAAEAAGGFSSFVAPLGWFILLLAVAAVTRLEGIPARLHSSLLALSVLYVAVVAAWFLVGSAPSPTGARLPATVPAVLLPVYGLGALLAGTAALWLWRRNPHGALRAALVGPGLLLMAAGVVNAFGSGILIRLADLLGSPLAASDSADGAAPAPILYPDWVGDVAVVTVFAFLVTAAVVTVVWYRAGEGPTCTELERRYADRGGLDCVDPDDRRWAERVGQAEVVARLTDRAGLVVAAVVAIVLVGLAGAVLASDDPTGLGLGSWAEPLAAPASVVLGAVPVLAVIGISRLYRSRSVRRLVGIIWDVATFWPRWFHPWSPPSYGERAVPQLGHRLSTLAEGEGAVVSAHSQGSVLAMATLARAELRTIRRVALLTHGSPLSRLYARYFPEYLSEELFREMAEEVPAWVNLWRPTDFIGGRIEAEGIDDRLVFDPPSSRPPSPGQPRPTPLRHSHYDRTEEYRAALGELEAMLRSG